MARIGSLASVRPSAGRLMMGSLTEADIEALVRRLDLSTKLRLITGAGMWETAAAPQIGLRSLTVSDGPVGVRGTEFAERNVSACFPSSSALAASWDDDLLYRLGAALAGEAVRKHVDVVLGPTINLHRSPLGGRHFECLSEDPFLSGRLATAYVRGLQDNGIGACPKHYVANDAETERFTVDNRVDERTLHELYLAPFEAVIADARPWSVMAAYNATNGFPMSENPLLAEPLKGVWEWDGAVISDWGGVYSTVASASGSLDLAMPGPAPLWGKPLLEAVRSGAVDEGALDEKVRRLLRLAGRTGALDDVDPPVGKRAAAEITASVALAREAASAGMVLLRNDGLLPLPRTSIPRIALIGPGVIEPRPLGGGSAMVFPPYISMPDAALRDAYGQDVEIVTAIGASHTNEPRPARSDELDRGIVRWLDAQGEVVEEETTHTGRLFRSPRAIPKGARSLELRTLFVPSVDGNWRIGVSGVGTFELDVDAATVLKESFVRDKTDMASLSNPPHSTVSVGMNIETPVAVTMRFRWLEDIILFVAGLVVQEPRGTEDEEMARAAELAASADMAVVIVGTSDAVESEGFDRTNLRLPGRQDELVAAVAAANPRTAVVVNAGAPVEMPWQGEVGAVLVAWFPGMEFGNALADVLVGNVEPGGRLPTTWPRALADAPVATTTPADGKLHYAEGLHIGFRGYLRAQTSPAYWFGHGLGYTEWNYENLAATPDVATVRLRNVGSRPGKEVVQIYTSRPESCVDRPARVLSGFATVTVDPGQAIDVEIPIDRRTLRHWDVSCGRWVVEPGLLVVEAGRSAGNLPLCVTTALA